MSKENDTQTPITNDISRIKLSNGEIYEIKDTETRRQLELLLGKKSS